MSNSICLPTRSCYIGRQHACPCPQMEYALLKWTTITHSAHWRALTRLDLNRSASASLPSSLPPTSPSSPSSPLHLLTFTFIPTLLTSSSPSSSPHLLIPTLLTLTSSSLPSSPSPSHPHPPHFLIPTLLTLTSFLLYSLSISSQKSQRTFGHACTCYRATSSKDGLYYCLRRVHREQLPSIVPSHPRVVSFSFSLQNFV